MESRLAEDSEERGLSEALHPAVNHSVVAQPDGSPRSSKAHANFMKIPTVAPGEQQKMIYVHIAKAGGNSFERDAKIPRAVERRRRAPTTSPPRWVTTSSPLPA